MPCLFKIIVLPLHRNSKEEAQNTQGSVGEWLKPPVC